MKIAVIGASGRTGRIVVKDALARGHQVVAVTRADGVSEPDDDKLVSARADVRDADALKRALVGADAIISALGVGTSRAATDVYSTGVSNTLGAMQSNGGAKLAVISAVPAGPWEEQPLLQRRIVLPILQHSSAPATTTSGAWKRSFKRRPMSTGSPCAHPAWSRNHPKAPTESAFVRWQGPAPSPTATSPEP